MNTLTCRGLIKSVFSFNLAKSVLLCTYLSGKLSILCMKFKLLLIDERFNIPFSFSRIEKQFVVINYVGLKLGALKDGNIPLVIWLKYSIWCNFLSYGALLLNFCMRVTEEDVHIITQRKFRSELIRKSYST